jgi:hypothetical protein
LIFQINTGHSPRGKFTGYIETHIIFQEGPDMKKTTLFLLHALIGWALCGAVMGIGMRLMPLQNALLVHLFAAPVIFAMVTLSYHKKAPSARPLWVAAGFTVFVMAMDFFLVAMVIQKSFAMFRSTMGTWLPFGMIFISSWRTGASMSGMRRRK